MIDFDLTESNMRRNLRPDEALVYNKFKEIKNLLLSNEISEKDGQLENWISGLYKCYRKYYREYYDKFKALDIDVCINFTYGALIVYAEASRNNKRKDIKFEVSLKDIGSRFILLSKELEGLGNGSYYVYDTVTDKVVYREDD